MAYLDYRPPGIMMCPYDPEEVLPKDHLARLIERVVESVIKVEQKPVGPGRPEFDPRLCIKVLLYGYAIGVRSSRQLERLCRESLPVLYLTRGAYPCYRTLCKIRCSRREDIERVWVGLYAIAKESGIARMGKITVDSTKIRADVSSESVLKKSEFDDASALLYSILKEADEADKREDMEGACDTRLGKEVDQTQMRDILRKLRSSQRDAKSDGSDGGQEEPVHITSKMRSRIKVAIKVIDAAKEEGLKHVSLTDPDSRMMGEGCEKNVRPCHSLEIATDNGLVVSGTITNESADNHRLDKIVMSAAGQEPDGITAVTADSGYFQTEIIDKLSGQGIDVCVPTGHTACDLKRGQPIGTTRNIPKSSVTFTYDRDTNSYHCPENNTLKFTQYRSKPTGRVLVYSAERSCTDCPLAKSCLVQSRAKRRVIHVRENPDAMHPSQQRFDDEAHVQRYRQRAPAIETVFAFIRTVLGYRRWLLRGAQGVASEASLIKTAFQLRKLNTAICRQ